VGRWILGTTSGDEWFNYRHCTDADFSEEEGVYFLALDVRQERAYIFSRLAQASEASA
jgi:hypothetical protein